MSAAAKRALYLPLLSAGLGLAVLLWAGRHFPVLQRLGQVQEAAAGLGWEALLLYPLLFAICNVLLLPAGTLALGSGWLFGFWRGAALNVVGNGLGALGAMVLARALGRRRLRRLWQHQPAWLALDQAVAREGWKVIFLLQLLPFAPSSLINYLCGLTQVPLRRALFWSALGQIPTMLVYAYAGTAARAGLQMWHRGGRPHGTEILLWGGGIGLTILVTVALSRLAGRLLGAMKAAASAGEAPPSPAGTTLTPRGEMLRSQEAPV